MERDPKVKKFYASKTWRKCQRAYKESGDGLCEKCKELGRRTAGEVVNHRDVTITPDNVDDPSVTLSHDHLILMCRRCYMQEHPEAYGHTARRYSIDEHGRIIAK